MNKDAHVDVDVDAYADFAFNYPMPGSQWAVQVCSKWILFCFKVAKLQLQLQFLELFRLIL